MSKSLFQAIKPLAKSLNELTKTAITVYSKEVDLIIISQSRDSHHIQHILDGILDFAFDLDMLKLYRKLCRYYYGLDPSAAFYYVEAYRSMWAPTDEEMRRAIETLEPRKHQGKKPSRISSARARLKGYENEKKTGKK
jgi:hypothetical protein